MCTDDRVQSVMSHDSLPVGAPVLGNRLLDMLPAGLLQRMRKRRCFADSDLNSSSLFSHRLLLAAPAVNQRQFCATAAANDSALITSPFDDVITTPPRYADTALRRMTERPPRRDDDRDVKTTSSASVTSQLPARRHSTTNHQLEPHDVAASEWAWRSSDTMTSLTEQPDLQLSCSSSTLLTPSSSSSPLPKSTLNFSVESLLAK